MNVGRNTLYEQLAYLISVSELNSSYENWEDILFNEWFNKYVQADIESIINRIALIKKYYIQQNVNVSLFGKVPLLNIFQFVLDENIGLNEDKTNEIELRINILKVLTIENEELNRRDEMLTRVIVEKENKPEEFFDLVVSHISLVISQYELNTPNHEQPLCYLLFELFGFSEQLLRGLILRLRKCF